MNGPVYVVIREGTGDGEEPSFVLGVFTEEEQAEEVRYAYDVGSYMTRVYVVPKIDEVLNYEDARFWGY